MYYYRCAGGKRKEGKIVRIVSHQVKKIVGLYEKSKSFGFVRPDNQRYLKDIYIPAGKEMGAMDGHKVVVELTSYGQEHAKPEGKIVEIIGHVNDPGADILSIVKDYDPSYRISGEGIESGGSCWKRCIRSRLCR